jgi:hypothetical protein
MRGLVLIAGESLWLPWLSATQEPWLSLEFLRALPEISDDGLELCIELERIDAPSSVIGIAALDNRMPKGGFSTWGLSIPVLSGESFRLRVRCEAGPMGNPNGDWLGITSLSVGEYSQAPLRRARSHGNWRVENELAHFRSLYKGEFYKHRQVNRRTTEAGRIRPLPTEITSFGDEVLGRRPVRLPPLAGDNVFTFSSRLLQCVLPITPPNFAGRLKTISARKGAPVRMLSICAGEAGVEGRILSEANVEVELCLLDINESLLDRAVEKIPDCACIDRVLGDANQLNGQLGRFDVINVTSGLHHLVELESVLAGISNSLDILGEFWLIGEQVGRNGSRLWPESRDVANKLFRDWPSAKRKNASTGAIDWELPDVDYSSACFEGIRSEEILALLDRYFLPVDVYVRNCFLWRLFNNAYASNFSLDCEKDVGLVEEAVAAELAHWGCGGRGTELFGVYSGKRARLACVAE